MGNTKRKKIKVLYQIRLQTLQLKNSYIKQKRSTKQVKRKTKYMHILPKIYF